MGQILLVRHGQASWGADDYDVLSELGESQAEVVGGWLASAVLGGRAPDVVVHGTLKRQRRSAEIASAAAGWSVDARTDERWNEIDHVGVLAAHPQDFEGSPNAGSIRRLDHAVPGTNLDPEPTLELPRIPRTPHDDNSSTTRCCVTP